MLRWALVAAGLVSAVAASGSVPDAREAVAAPRLTFYPSLQLRFEAGERANHFLSYASIVNSSGKPMSDLVFHEKFPKQFKPRLIESGREAGLLRPEGFSQSLEKNEYTLKVPELRIAETIVLAVHLDYKGRPGEITFPGIEVEYVQDGTKATDQGPDQTWDVSKATKYSGTMKEFVKRYAGMDMDIPTEESWGFSNLVHRTTGRVATGPVDIQEERGGRLHFSIEAGVPGDLKQMMVLRRPLRPERFPKAGDEVRRRILDIVQSSADFTLDADEMETEKRKVGRYEAWVADTIWIDKVKDRFGEGPSRWYLIANEDNGNEYIINISAQGRGVGPGKADVPNPSRESELMSELERIVASLRIIV